MSSTIDDRVLLLLQNTASAVPGLAGHGVWERLGVQTGIPAQRWRNVVSGRQRATTAMVEALARRWPQHAFWLSTGITDVANGHRAPINAVSFPERLQADDGTSATYFRACLKLAARLYEEAGVDMDDDAARLQASTRTLQLAHYDGGPMINTAHRLAGSEEYAEALHGWVTREKHRPTFIKQLVGADPLVGPSQRKSADGEPLFGGDGQSRHQSPSDMFFRPYPNNE